MACTGCSVTKSEGEYINNTGCSSGSCNKLNTFDWLSAMQIEDAAPFPIVEVSFKNGARKDFFISPAEVPTTTGDTVVVEAGTGYDIGRITLSGELVKLQMKKKNVREDSIQNKILRIAHERDLQKLAEARALEKETMVKARVLARVLELNMKIGDVEFQGDKRKATFYYTAEGRIDFRELIRHFARDFKVKIEMRQIGSRQESARIGGIGSCGRELCCSTWLSDFKSVSTAAARYQNIAINQTKLSGQCGRLKCCLNYELDTYMDALKVFPKHADKLETKLGTAILIKTDIFKGIMYYVYKKAKVRGKFYALDTDTVKEILAQNKKGEHPTDLGDMVYSNFEPKDEFNEDNIEFDSDLTGVIELPPEKKKPRSRRSKKNRRRGKGKPSATNKSGNKTTTQKKKTTGTPTDKKPTPNKKKTSSSRRSNRHKNRNRNRNNNNDNNNNNKKE